MQKYLPLFAFAAVLLLAGAGCAQNASEPYSTKSADSGTTQEEQDAGAPSETPSEEEPSGDEEAAPSEFTLSAEAVGNRTVRFEWQVPKDLAKEAEGYRFSHSRDNLMNGLTSWWWERGPAHRDHEWSGLPLGPSYFRLCIVRNGRCTEQSNIVGVDVQ